MTGIIENASRAALEPIFDASVFEEHFALVLEEIESPSLAAEVHQLLLECGAESDSEGAYQFSSLESLRSLMEAVSARLEGIGDTESLGYNVGASGETIVFDDLPWSTPTELASEDVEPLQFEARGYRLRKIPFSSIRANTGHNPRRSTARAGIVRLARSISTRGLLQPITVRPDGTDKDAFDLVFGYRRHAAIGYAIAQGWLPEDHLVVCILRRLNDSQVRLAALTENEEREEVNLLDQAEGWARLRFTQTETAIADASGVTVNNVRRCLKVAAGVCEEVKALYRQGDLEWNALIAFSYGSFEMQRDYLKTAAKTPWRFSVDQVKAAMTATEFKLANARFSLEAYEAAGGKLETDLWNSAEGTRLLSPEIVVRLQSEWAQQQVEMLTARGYPFVEVRSGEWSWWSEFARTKRDAPEAGAVVYLRPDLSVEVIEGLIPVAVTNTSSDKALGDTLLSSPSIAIPPNKQQAEFSESGVSLIRRTRTAALQEAILEHTDPKLPLALAILGFFGEREMRFKVAPLGDADAITSNPILEALRNVAVELPRLNFSPTLGLELDTNVKHNAALRFELFQALLKLPLERLEGVHRLLVATMIGDFVSATDGLSQNRRRDPICDGLITALAAHLGVQGGEAFEVTETYLKAISFRKAKLSPYLARAFGDGVASVLLERPKGKLIAELLKHQDKFEGFTPPELDFAENAPRLVATTALGNAVSDQTLPLEPVLESVATDD
jgi:ParB/RepB/Spo0J family partition protein